VSNAQKKTSGTFSLKDYQDKARKIAAESGPFKLEVDTDKVIEIPRPDGNTMVAIESAASSRELITLLCGEHADEILELFGPEDHTALKALGTDIQKHFGIGQ
jgi:hypothetical protein